MPPEMNRSILCVVTALLGCLGCGLVTPTAESDAAKQGRMEATKDLAEGNPQFYFIGLPWDLAPRVDSHFGLPTHNLGCNLNDETRDHRDAYNRTVAAWIAANGPPPNSVMMYFVDENTARMAIANGQEISEGKELWAQDGRHAEYRDGRLSLWLPGGRPEAYSLGGVKGQPIVGWGKDSSVFFEIEHERCLKKLLYHVRLDHQKAIQLFEEE
jgi:hypothetical protein